MALLYACGYDSSDVIHSNINTEMIQILFHNHLKPNLNVRTSDGMTPLLSYYTMTIKIIKILIVKILMEGQR